MKPSQLVIMFLLVILLATASYGFGLFGSSGQSRPVCSTAFDSPNGDGMILITGEWMTVNNPWNDFLPERFCCAEGVTIGNLVCKQEYVAHHPSNITKIQTNTSSFSSENENITIGKGPKMLMFLSNYSNNKTYTNCTCFRLGGFMGSDHYEYGGLCYEYQTLVLKSHPNVFNCDEVQK